MKPSFSDARLSGPLLLSPAYSLDQFQADLQRPAAEYNHALDVAAVYGVTMSGNEEKPYPFADGIAYISVRGSLVNRSMASYSFMTGYKAIQSKLDAAVADQDVLGIVLDVDSYGGEAAGCFECAEAVMAARAAKPVLAVVDSNAYSAGFALAVAATRVVVIPSGGTGSVGVCTMHVDVSGALAENGIAVTMLYKGSHKVDGNPYNPLPVDVKADILDRLEERYVAFTEFVDRARALPAGTARATQARIYGAQAALDLGLIDAIAPAPQALSEFRDSLAPVQPGVFFMENTMSQDTAAQGVAEAQASARSEARAEERARCKAILTHAEADGRSDLASHLAFDTDLSAENASAMLSKAPKASAAPVAAAAPANPLAAAMASAGTPGLGADGASGPVGTSEEEQGAAAAASVLSAFSLATGRKF